MLRIIQTLLCFLPSPAGVVLRSIFANISSLFGKLLGGKSFFVTLASQAYFASGSGILPISVSFRYESKMMLRTGSEPTLAHCCQAEVAESIVGRAVVVQPIMLHAPLGSKRSLITLGPKHVKLLVLQRMNFPGISLDCAEPGPVQTPILL